jgi:hypothetical protein
MNRHAALTPRSDLRHAALTSSSDLCRAIPSTTALRVDQTHTALASLREEERRLERLGLEEALRRCREQLRYWEFLSALFALPAASRSRVPRAHGSR